MDKESSTERPWAVRLMNLTDEDYEILSNVRALTGHGSNAPAVKQALYNYVELVEKVQELEKITRNVISDYERLNLRVQSFQVSMNNLLENDCKEFEQTIQLKDQLRSVKKSLCLDTYDRF